MYGAAPARLTPWYNPHPAQLLWPPCDVGFPLPFHDYCWLGMRLLEVWASGYDAVSLNSDPP